MEFLKRYRNRFICKLELVSAADGVLFSLEDPQGLTVTQPPEASYHGVYFTLSGLSLTQETKFSSAGYHYAIKFRCSMPTFPGVGSFMQQFARLGEIRITENTGHVHRLCKNDVILNRPMEVTFGSDLQQVEMETTLLTLFPLELYE